ncbi:hypothetical protein HJ590_03885 [Naumannella sp. ID2617S]|nr:hypothetical protein [Naumannella sp. ID2617S]
MSATADFVVCLYRPTHNIEQMVRFLEVLGLHQTVRRDVDGAAFVWGRGGVIALFPAEGAARPGRSELTLETADLDAAEERLRIAGMRTRQVHDTDFPGISVTAPDGRSMWIAESFRDPDDQGADYPHRAIDVLALHHASNTDDAVGFFELFGFRPQARGDNLWLIMFANAESGAIAIEGRGGIAEQGPIMVQLGLRTEEPLAEVAARLAAAGHPVGEVTELGGFPFLAVTDPDQITLGIFQVGPEVP